MALNDTFRTNAPIEGPSSAASVSIGFVVLAVVLACADNFADPDLWGHLLIGKSILSGGHIPSHETFSYTVAGFPVRNHEWLAEVVFALAYRWCGVLGLKLVKLSCATVSVLALRAGLARTAASRDIQRTVLILTAAALTPQMQFRPQLFTFAMLSVVMMMLAAETYRARVNWWPIVPMFALWANLHGGFVVGLGALGIAAGVLSAQELFAGTLPYRGLRLGVVTLIAACATLVNPSGMGIWGTVFHSVSDPLLRVIILDWITLPRMVLHLWRDTSAGLIQVIIAIGLFGAFAYSLLAAPSYDDAPMTAVAIVFVGAAFYMARNLALGLIAVAIPLSYHMALVRSRRVSLVEKEAPGPQRELRVGFVAVVIVIAAVAGGLLSPRLPTWQPIPSGALAFIQSQNLRGNFLNQFEWGHYLMWHLPQNRIFVDSRTELAYPDSVIKEYAEFFYGQHDARRAVDNYPTDFILMKTNTAAVRVVESDPDWKIVYRDQLATLFARTSSPIAARTEIVKADDSKRDYFP